MANKVFKPGGNPTQQFMAVDIGQVDTQGQPVYGLAVALANPVAGGPSASVVPSSITFRQAIEITRPAGAVTYSAGAMVGSLITIPNCGRIVAGTGYVTVVRLATDQALAGVFRVYIWNTAPTVPADNAPFALLYADISPVGKLVGWTDITVAPEGVGSNSAYGFDAFLRWPFVCAAGSQNLHGTIVARGSYAALTAQKFSLGLGLAQD